jgi:hypothetical protein
MRHVYSQLETGKSPVENLKKSIDADKGISRIVQSWVPRTGTSFLMEHKIFLFLDQYYSWLEFLILYNVLNKNNSIINV